MNIVSLKHGHRSEEKTNSNGRGGDVWKSMRGKQNILSTLTAFAFALISFCIELHSSVTLVSLAIVFWT